MTVNYGSILTLEIIGFFCGKNLKNKIANNALTTKAIEKNKHKFGILKI
jgi:hypothetical protein